LKRRFVQDSRLPPHVFQNYTLNICNYLLLALETVLSASNYSLAKIVVAEMYNSLLEFLAFKRKTVSIFHLLIKSQILIFNIPY